MTLRFFTKEQKLDLAREAMAMAIDVRFRAGYGLEQPICAYTTCDRLGVPVRFVSAKSMEGIYRRLPAPRIILSANRPLVRRHFNCAHELGHHLFEHGSNVHELQQSVFLNGDDTPEEFLVNSFAGHLLMPVLGIRDAFSKRKINLKHLEPEQAFAVASEYSVGYETLLTHLAVSLHEISATQKDELLKARGKLKRSIVPSNVSGHLVLLDSKFDAPTCDVEVEHLIVAPPNTKAANDLVTRIAETHLGPLFQAKKRGSVELFVPNSSWAVHLRIAQKDFVGLAQYRHLEVEDGEDDEEK